VGPLGEDEVSRRVVVVTLCVPAHGKVGRWGGFFAYVGSWATGAQLGALSHGSLAMIKWTAYHLRERFAFSRRAVRLT
jgi:hypothetical protein